jgi:NAD(P)-dependent dehydrogenase (short-subunit alcohol dehydrogenase family)
MPTDWGEEELESSGIGLEMEEAAPQPKPMGYRGGDKLWNKIAIITGGESALGRAIAVAFAREGADVVVVYQDDYREAEKTCRLVKDEDRRCLLIAGDVGDEAFCQSVVQQTLETFSRIDILVNNADEQHLQECIENISADQLEHTFQTNVFSMFYMIKAVLHHLKPGSSIINTASEAAYHGEPNLLDYSATKGAVVAFTKSLARSLVDRDIRVNGVAPGPVWTPLIPAALTEDREEDIFDNDLPLKRAGQPEDIAPVYVFLASRDSSYMTGEILHPNGSEYISP